MELVKKIKEAESQAKEIVENAHKESAESGQDQGRRCVGFGCGG